jgi:D-alanine--poly(phosphoribitol) ligase subunit 1
MTVHVEDARLLAAHRVPSPLSDAKWQAHSLFDLFFAARLCYGDRPALWVEGSFITYAELYDAAARLAGAIGIARGSQIPAARSQCGLLVNRTATAYTAVLASSLAGSAYVPLNPRCSRERLRDMVLSSAIDTLIVDHNAEAAAGPLLESVARPLTVLLPDAAATPDWARRAPRHWYIRRPDIEGAAPAAAPRDVSGEDGAYLLFTSGIAGTPCGVLVSNAGALAYLENAKRRYRPGPVDRFSQLFDFSCDLSVHDMFLAWGAGACLYVAPEDVSRLSDFIRRCQLSFWFSRPSTAALMRESNLVKPAAYPSLRWSLFCREALPMALAAAWQDAAPASTIENLYGSTETTIALTAYRLPKKPRPELAALPTVPIGAPFAGQRTLIVDANGRPLLTGEAGELYLGGSQVAAGYWQAPERTAAWFQPPRSAPADGTRWYRTGDCAIMMSDYGLVHLGRMDEQPEAHSAELVEIEHAVPLAPETDTLDAAPWPLGDDGFAPGIVDFTSLPKPRR